MKSRRRILALAAFTLAALLSPTGGVEACGPFFYDDVFVRPHQPDDLASFAKGQLGLLQAGYDSDEYAVAYRYLAGGTLDAKEQSAIKAPFPYYDFQTPEQSAVEQAMLEAAPPRQWHKARSEFLPDAVAAGKPEDAQLGRYLDSNGNVVLTDSFHSCPDPAYTTAALTLRKRAATWGKSSSALFDWIHAQDAVFSKCATKNADMPAPAPADAPALLRADRAYQTAAANFYAENFDEAIRQFTAIASDRDSPWREWGPYLAARATVRKAFSMTKETDRWSGNLATFDSATMQQAQQMLEKLLAEPHPVPSREAVQSELNFIRIRTEPAKRMAEISADLEGPAHDPHFAQNLADLNWILLSGALRAPEKDSHNYLQLADKDLPPLFVWIAAWRGLYKPEATYALWQQTYALPWLVVTLAKASATDPFAHELLSAAEAVPANSPAYQTVFYHRVRLLLESNRLDEARALLDPALAATDSKKADSWRNALLSERMSAARDFKEFLSYAPRTALETGSSAAVDLRAICQKRAGLKIYDNKTAPCPELDRPLTFDSDATGILNEKTPLARLIEAAQSPALPANLRQNIAIIAWTRAVVLDDAKSAAVLAPLLPKALKVTPAKASGFPALVTILRNDGIQPRLNPGVARVASYNQFDQYRDNGWCQLGAPQTDSDNAPPPQPVLPQPVLFPPAEQQQAAAEYARLKALPDSQDLIGQRILDYAKAHPTDPLVPEALHLAVRSTHFGCSTYDPQIPWDQRPQFNPVSKALFLFLHKQFPNSPWARRTRTSY